MRRPSALPPVVASFASLAGPRMVIASRMTGFGDWANLDERSARETAPRAGEHVFATSRDTVESGRHKGRTRGVT